MIEVRDMSEADSVKLLERVGYAHLACSRDGQPYVIPIHYAYAYPDIYIYTTDGKKTDIIRSNPRVCLQVEEVIDNANWESVVVNGEAIRIIDRDERDAALSAIASVNPTLTPAVSVRWMDSWVRENIEVMYRITPQYITGRRTISDDNSVPFTPRKMNPPA